MDVQAIGNALEKTMHGVEEKVTQHLSNFHGAFAQNCALWEQMNEEKWVNILKEVKNAQEQLSKQYEEDRQKMNDAITDALQPVFTTTALVDEQKKGMQNMEKRLGNIQKETTGAIRTLVGKVQEISLLGGGNTPSGGPNSNSNNPQSEFDRQQMQSVFRTLHELHEVTNKK